MAEEKKKAAEVTAAAEVAEPAADGREDIFIPRGPKNDDPNLFVSVNGKNYLLPHEVAEEIHRAWEAEEIRTRNEEKLANGEPLTGE